jgi:thymidylate synthase (FAD)
MDDKGYVRLVGVLGDDLSVVNAARVSFNKESQSLNSADKKLIFYLAKHEHTSPFRHEYLTFEVYTPLMVARQWWKHCIASNYCEASGWNESSRRYVTEDCEFYIPKEWRLKGKNIKQGSSDEIFSESKDLSEKLEEHIKKSLDLYNEALEKNICIEQARFFLPAYILYVRFRWSASLQAVHNFIRLRTDPSAQKEIRDYAIEVEKLVKEKFPVSLEALNSTHSKE